MQNEKIEKIAQERIDQVRNKVEIMSEFARSNKLAMGAHIFIAALISLTYLIEVFKGSRSIGYVAFVIVLGLASPIAEITAEIRKLHRLNTLYHWDLVYFTHSLYLRLRIRMHMYMQFL